MKILFAFLVGLYANFVNPFVGTDEHGHTFPGAAWPFGMVQLGPDTRVNTWDGCSGYHYSDEVILGFTHTHLSGTGCLDWGDVLVMPVRDYVLDSLDRNVYSSPFSHKREIATPGYYKVYLDKPDVWAKMTVGRRCGMQVYSYGEGGSVQVLIDLQHRDPLQGSEIRRVGDRTIAGFRRSHSWADRQTVHFYIEFDTDIVDYKAFGDEGALLTFPAGTKAVKIKSAISSVSSENAQLNLESEISPEDWDFSGRCADARLAWENYLGKIEVRGHHRDLRTFYTALYHTAIHPSLYSDANGEYLGMDRQVHKAEGFDRYTVFSIWDTFRAEHPLFCLIERGLTEDFLRSFLCIWKEGGKLPIWELSGHETNCMIGYNSVSVIADAMAKGIVDAWDPADVEELLRAAVASSRKAEFGLDVYREYGCVIADLEHESVSKTLEYAYDDWCVAQIASYVLSRADCNYPEAAAIRDEYLASSLYYRNVFDPATGFMRARLNGCFLTPFDPHEVNNHYTEANCWQYSFFVPHDIAGHIALLGGEEAYCAKIDSLFNASEKTSGRTQVDITGLIGQYAHGNEPSHHIAWLYAYAGHPEKTASMVRRILREQYSARPDGLCGNEDCGQMSAWYVMSSMGLYSVCPGQPELVRTKPFFRKVVIHLEDGTDMLISRSDAIRSYEPTSVDAPMVTNPVFVSSSERFYDNASVKIEGGEGIFWSLNGGPAMPYEGEITLGESCTLEAFRETPEGRSKLVRSCYHQISRDRSVTIYSHYNPQYSGGGDNALIDGIRGKLNWRTGAWQGYQAQDFEAVVDLLSTCEISYISSGYCQDVRSWIWMPTSVEYFISVDGEEWTPVGKLGNSLGAAPDDYTIQTAEAELTLPKAMPARYVKVVAHNFGTIPEWHLGAGGEAFIFVDEISVL